MGGAYFRTANDHRNSRCGAYTWKRATTATVVIVKTGKCVYQRVAMWLSGSKPGKRCLKSVRHYEGTMIET